MSSLFFVLKPDFELQVLVELVLFVVLRKLNSKIDFKTLSTSPRHEVRIHFFANNVLRIGEGRSGNSTCQAACLCVVIHSCEHQAYYGFLSIFHFVLKFQRSSNLFLDLKFIFNNLKILSIVSLFIPHKSPPKTIGNIL